MIYVLSPLAPCFRGSRSNESSHGYNRRLFCAWFGMHSRFSGRDMHSRLHKCSLTFMRVFYKLITQQAYDTHTSTRIIHTCLSLIAATIDLERRSLSFFIHLMYACLFELTIFRYDILPGCLNGREPRPPMISLLCTSMMISDGDDDMMLYCNV